MAIGPTRRSPLAALLAVVGLAIVGCGSSGGTSAAAANCLRGALDNDAPTGSCQHGRTFNATPAGTTLAKPTHVAGTVTCIGRTGNEYDCQDGSGNDYSVLYDGQRIAYQQTQ